jgi:WD40 repeat protein
MDLLSKNIIWNECVNQDDGNTKKLNDLMELYEDDLFICHNSTIFNSIRYLNLKSFKSLCVKEQTEVAKNSFKEIKINRTIDHYVNCISINKNGKLLALIGEEGVDVMIIPQTVNQLNIKELHANIITVGADIYSSNNGIKIVKAAWHPLSSTNSHIVILSSDGCLRLFDVSSESKEPEQLYYVGPQYYDEYKYFNSSVYIPGRSISGNSEEMEAVSFTFGGGDDWEIFTVYVLMKNGDVYAICPFLPSKSIVKKSLLENLSVSIEQRWKESDPDDLVIDQQYKLQRCWISTVLQELKPVKSDNLDKDEEVIIYGNISRFKDIHPVIQGPFLFQPAPVEFDPDKYELDNIASSIISLKTEPFSIIVIAYTNGKVDVCLNVAPVEALWMSNNEIIHDFDLPILAVYETIDLKLKDSLPNIENNVVNIKEDKYYPDICYLYHHGGVHSISFNNWLSLFKDIDNNINLIQKFQDILKREIPSEVSLKVDTLVFGNENPIVGLDSSTGVFVGYNLLVLGASSEFVSLELPIRIKTAPLLFNKNDDNDYKDLIPTVPLKNLLPIHLGSGKKSNQFYPNFVDENTLKYLAEQIVTARKDLTDLEVFRNTIEKKVTVQKEEFFKQLKNLKKIDQRVSINIKDNTENLSLRMKNIIERQATLIRRADVLLQILFDRCQPELTEEEKKWFSELKHLSSIITKKHKPHIIQLRQQLDRLKEETKDTIEMTEQAVILGTSQKKTIYEALNQESVNLMNTLNSLNILQNKMENLKINNQ